MNPEESIQLRQAAPSDASLVFDWRNDPFIIEHSSSQSTVSWDEHRTWFEQSLTSEDRIIYIAIIDGHAAGLVRFDREGDAQCVISAYLTKSWVGRGLGVTAIRKGCERAFERWPVDRIIACVLHGNPKGQRAFTRAGFNKIESDACPEGHFSLARTRSQTPA